MFVMMGMIPFDQSLLERASGSKLPGRLGAGFWCTVASVSVEVRAS